jgi:hypothetical protein
MKKPIYIGHSLIYRDDRQCKYTYIDIKEKGLVGKDGWVDIKDVLPHPYDMHDLEIEGKERIYKGWWTGSGWDGLRIKPDMRVTRWRN